MKQVGYFFARLDVTGMVRQQKKTWYLKEKKWQTLSIPVDLSRPCLLACFCWRRAWPDARQTNSFIMRDPKG
jgi:hypothetical protein